MIGEAIGFALRNVSAELFVLALVVAALRRGRPLAIRFLDWLLLLGLGLTFLWAAFYHLVFPDFAAAFIGWAPSPFQFEVGIADLAFGIVACVAFWRTLAFKEAAVIGASIALLGDAAGHVRQMIEAGNFAPGNAGPVFWTDILAPATAIVCLIAAKRAAGDGRLTHINKPPGV